MGTPWARRKGAPLSGEACIRRRGRSEMWARVDACAYVATVCRSLGENVTAAGRGRNLAWSIAAVVMPLTLLAGGIYSLTVLLGASAWVRHTDEVRVKVAVLRGTLMDGETAARGYLLTGERPFLGPYEQTSAEWRQRLGELRRLTSDNSGQQRRLQELEEIITRELTNVEKMITGRESGGTVATLLPQMQQSKVTMDAARVLLADMEREEARLDAIRRTEATRRGELTMLLFGTGAALAVVIVTMIGRQRRSAELRRVRAEEEGRLLQDVFAGIEDGITLQDRTGKLIFANASAARMIGFPTVEALLGASLAEIMARFQIFDEEGRPFPLEKLPSRAILAGSRREETALIRYRLSATGEEKWSVTQSFPVRDGGGNVVRAIKLFRDVTHSRMSDERRKFLLRAVDELNSSLDYESTLAALARLAVPVLADWCGVDILEDGQVKRLATAHVDPSKMEFVAELERRYPSDPKSPNGVHEIMRTGQAQLMAEIPGELLRASAVDAEHLRLIEALELRSYMGVPLLVSGRVLGAITFAMAESHRIYTEDDLAFARAVADRAAPAIENAQLFRAVELARAATTKQLVAEEQRRREAEEQTRFAETFVGMLGHDLRNPLNAILMTTRLLAKRAPDDTGALVRIHSSAQRMANMVAQLLDLTRSRIAGGIPIDRKALDLGVLVTEVVDELARAYPAREIVWSAGAEAAASLDRDRVAQVVSNLVGNAVEHGDPARPVTVRLQATERTVTLTVHNDGPPIPPELLPALFEPFRR